MFYVTTVTPPISKNDIFSYFRHAYSSGIVILQNIMLAFRDMKFCISTGNISNEINSCNRFSALKGFCVNDAYNPMYIKIMIEMVMSGFCLIAPLLITTGLYVRILSHIYRSGKKFLRY